MNNYYEFTKFDEDGFAMDIFNAMSDERLKGILDDYFNELAAYLALFKGKDYDEFYYQAKSLLEQINDIKIILNILLERSMDE